jgi:hypothetical protein
LDFFRFGFGAGFCPTSSPAHALVAEERYAAVEDCDLEVDEGDYQFKPETGEASKQT